GSQPARVELERAHARGRRDPRGHRRRRCVRSAPACEEPALRVPHPHVEHDCVAFMAADTDPVLSTVRRIFTSEIERTGDFLLYRIEATAFLKHMVRNIVGTLVEIGRGERPAPDMAAV